MLRKKAFFLAFVFLGTLPQARAMELHEKEKNRIGQSNQISVNPIKDDKSKEESFIELDFSSITPGSQLSSVRKSTGKGEMSENEIFDPSSNDKTHPPLSRARKGFLPQALELPSSNEEKEKRESETQNFLIQGETSHAIHAKELDSSSLLSAQEKEIEKEQEQEQEEKPTMTCARNRYAYQEGEGLAFSDPNYSLIKKKEGEKLNIEKKSIKPRDPAQSRGFVLQLTKTLNNISLKKGLLSPHNNLHNKSNYKIRLTIDGQETQWNDNEWYTAGRLNENNLKITSSNKSPRFLFAIRLGVGEEGRQVDLINMSLGTDIYFYDKGNESIWGPIIISKDQLENTSSKLNGRGTPRIISNRWVTMEIKNRFAICHIGDEEKNIIKNSRIQKDLEKIKKPGEVLEVRNLLYSAPPDQIIEFIIEDVTPIPLEQNPHVSPRIDLLGKKFEVNCFKEEKNALSLKWVMEKIRSKEGTLEDFIRLIIEQGPAFRLEYALNQDLIIPEELEILVSVLTPEECALFWESISPLTPDSVKKLCNTKDSNFSSQIDDFIEKVSTKANAGEKEKQTRLEAEKIEREKIERLAQEQRMEKERLEEEGKMIRQEIMNKLSRPMDAMLDILTEYNLVAAKYPSTRPETQKKDAKNTELSNAIRRYFE